MSTELSARQAEVLLDELCVKQGFCLPPETKARLMAEPPGKIDEFTDAVLRAEGLEPDSVLRDLRRGVRATVAEHFRRAEDEWQFRART